MGTACEGRSGGLHKLSVDVGLDDALLCPVVHGSGCALHEILKGSVAASHQGFRQDQPALGLGEDAAVFLGVRIEDVHQGTVEIMVHIRGLQKLCTVRGVQDVVDTVHGLLCLVLAGKAGDHGPALGVQPHVRFRILLCAHDDAVVPDAADEAVLVPALCKGSCQLALHLFQVSAVLGIVSVGGKLLHHLQSVVELEGHEGGLSLGTHPQAVIPVRMESGGHVVGAHMGHGEVDGSL